MQVCRRSQAPFSCWHVVSEADRTRSCVIAIPRVQNLPFHIFIPVRAYWCNSSLDYWLNNPVKINLLFHITQYPDQLATHLFGSYQMNWILVYLQYFSPSDFCHPQKCHPISSLFLSCYEIEVSTKYWELCQADICSCKTSRCECAFFEEMARRCNEGLSNMWKNWRNETGCGRFSSSRSSGCRYILLFKYIVYGVRDKCSNIFLSQRRPLAQEIRFIRNVVLPVFQPVLIQIPNCSVISVWVHVSVQKVRYCQFLCFLFLYCLFFFNLFFRL